jgi:hypothetical protein
MRSKLLGDREQFLAERAAGNIVQTGVNQDNSSAGS